MNALPNSAATSDFSGSSQQSASSEYFEIDLNMSYSYKNQIEFYENNQPGLVLALIRVFDRDTLNNYKFVIQSVTSNYHEETSMFKIRVSDKANREFELIAVNSFNSELIQNYKLKINLYDLEEDMFYSASLTNENIEEKVMNSNEYNFCTSLIQRIKILDINDNKPEFGRKYYEFSLRENEVNLTLNSFNQIEVFDLDSSELNSKVTFTIVDKTSSSSFDSTGHFNVNDLNGNYPIVIVKNPFDYEIDGSLFEFYLNAFDLDNLTDTALISVKIEDVNDNAPTFINDNATFFVKENVPVNSFIGQIIALDKDSAGPNSDISFRILNENLRSLFKVYKTGVISNWMLFDREGC